ncbi:MAG: HD domain-containing protein [Armatimonadetes bacterium]|nr:HD domain-containing protein [Armatimonadota bacterium]
MRRMPVDALSPGLVVAKTIYGERGDVLLRKGTAITGGVIAALTRREFRAIYVRDGLADDIEPPDIVAEHIRANVTKHVHDAFAVIHAAARSLAREGSKEKSSPVPSLASPALQVLQSLYQDIENIIDEVLEVDTLDGLVSLKSHDTYTFCHSVDVTIAALALGKRLALPRDTLRQLALGCLLHDIGKVFVDPAILRKPAALTPEEWAVIHRHPQWSYETISQMPFPEILPRHVGWQHHERQDGSGYPRGLRGFNRIARTAQERFDPDGILLVTEITQVADVYSALASDRPHRPALPTEMVVTTLRQMAGAHLNTEMLDLFLSLVPVYGVGTSILVTEGRLRGFQGLVTANAPAHPDRPVIRLLFDPQGKRIEPLEVNLHKEQGLQIASTPDLPHRAPALRA